MIATELPGWVRELPGVRLDEPVARHSQFGIGGPADAWVRVPDATALASLLERAAGANVPITVLGAGSNTLVLDGGIRGIAIELGDRHLRVIDAESSVGTRSVATPSVGTRSVATPSVATHSVATHSVATPSVVTPSGGTRATPGVSPATSVVVELGGGAMLPRIALDLARQGLAGLEFGIGVPGTCGASVRGNAGAFGREITDVLIDCDVLTPQGAPRTVTHDECDFAYRRSAFTDGDLRAHIVTAARFTVHPDKAAEVRARVDDITARRKASQPWGQRSLGSVFKNPPGDHAGRLVEACGLKGTREGGAEISRKHANFIVNTHSATAADVLALVRRAHDTVLEHLGVDLETEIVTVGEPVP
jgi:UDP-N-acetylmuramate dehydrogenase